MLSLVIILAGLAAIFIAFDRLETSLNQRGMKKQGRAYKPQVEVMKVGYVVMFVFFALACLTLPGGGGGGSSDDFDPCMDTAMRC